MLIREVELNALEQVYLSKWRRIKKIRYSDKITTNWEGNNVERIEREIVN